MTAEDYGRTPPGRLPSELVRGVVIERPWPFPFHGFVCGNLCSAVQTYLETNPVGRPVSNRSGVVTRRDPDTVRGPDVSFYSFARLPGPLPRDEYARVVPDLVAEVVSPSDRWAEVLAKVAEYLAAGVTVVVVVEPRAREVVVYRDDRPAVRFGPGDVFEFPDVLPGFAAPVRGLFE